MGIPLPESRVEAHDSLPFPSLVIVWRVIFEKIPAEPHSFNLSTVGGASSKHLYSSVRTNVTITVCLGDMKALQLVALILAVLALASPVHAYRFGVGDGLAIVLFLVIGVVGVCALLGWIARRRANS